MIEWPLRGGSSEAPSLMSTRYQMTPGSSRLGEFHATFSNEHFHISLRRRFSGILLPPIRYYCYSTAHKDRCSLGGGPSR